MKDNSCFCSVLYICLVYCLLFYDGGLIILFLWLFFLLFVLSCIVLIGLFFKDF